METPLSNENGAADSGKNDFAELIERVRLQSEGAARELVERYGDHILRVIRWRMHRRLRSKFDSQDFVQSVWASFFGMPLRTYHFGEPEELAQFLAGLASNKVVEAVRKRLWSAKCTVDREEVSLNDSQRAPALRERLVAPGSRAEEIAIAKEEWRKVTESRPNHHQEILNSAASGKSLRELAAEIGVNERTIRRVLRHAAARKQS